MMTRGLLEGLKVLDLSLWQPGHTATQLLADLGADILKIEPPGGDRMRAMPERFLNFNGHKRSLPLDLKSEEGRTRLMDLVRQAEVVVEGFRPGVADRLGVGYDHLRAANPALVYCSISGFGHTGPLAQVNGHEQNYQAYAGVFVTPSPGAAPVAAGALIGDQGSGLAAAFAIVAAVLCARRTGEGEHIDVSMADLLLSWSAVGGQVDDRPPVPAGSTAPPGMGTYRAADGYVVLGVYSEAHFWDLLCRHLGLDSFIGLDMAARMASGGEIETALQAEVFRRPAGQLIAELDAIGVPIAPVLTRAQAMDHPHFQVRGVMSRGSEGERRIAHPIRYVRHPALSPGHAPGLGEGGALGFAAPDDGAS